MPQNFIACDREQGLLMPPSLLDWVAEDHLVWTILAAVEEMDLAAIYETYRPDGHGRPAYEPSMMTALLIYAYSQGNRSSRGIERKCREDVVYMLITARRVPDHSTIAEFRRRHETALAALFTHGARVVSQGWAGQDRDRRDRRDEDLGERFDGRHPQLRADRPRDPRRRRGDRPARGRATR
jgi:transposase